MNSFYVLYCCIVLLSSLFVTSTSKTNNEILNMDVEWIIQGYNFGFQGFFVELLGLSSGLIKLIPQLKITQSSFKKTFNDEPHKNLNKFFTEETFDKEGKAGLWLYSNEQPSSPNNEGFKRIGSSIFSASTIDTKICSSCNNDNFDDNNNDIDPRSMKHKSENKLLIGGNLVRSFVSNALNPQQCCRACVNQELCIAWSFLPNTIKYSQNTTQFNREYLDSSIYGCHLKGSIPTDNVEIEGAMSGTFYNQKGGRLSFPKAVILHGTTCYNQNITISRSDPNLIIIGRYMIERYPVKGLTLDESAVMHCASMVSEIWVPTQWHKELFNKLMRNMGISAPEIAIIPEAVDTELFDPSLARISKIHYSDRLLHDYCNSNDNTCTNNLPIFEFLSIFKWEHRKGWNVLLDAYWKAFQVDDAVVLRLRTYVPSWEMGTKNITLIMEEYARDNYKKELNQLARIVWESGENPDNLSDSATRMDMRDLLASADAFVLPTRGEGWGLPIAEAMSMALPVIVSNCAGPIAYATNDNSYLIPVLDQFDDLGFAEPNTDALSNILLQVIEDSAVKHGVSYMKGLAARETMKVLSPEYVASKITERLRDQAGRRGWNQ